MRVKLSGTGECIETGYMAYYTGYFRIGEHYFKTQDFFDMITGFSKSPEKTSHLLMGYGEEFFYSELMRYNIEMLNVGPFNPEGFEELVKACHGTTANLETAYSDDSSDPSVPVMVEAEKDNVTVGTYSIGKRDFNALCRYAVNGGGGWAFETPKFADEAKRLMESSENPIYRDL